MELIPITGLQLEVGALRSQRLLVSVKGYGCHCFIEQIYPRCSHSCSLLRYEKAVLEKNMILASDKVKRA